jgi:hypothetical protein
MLQDSDTGPRLGSRRADRVRVEVIIDARNGQSRLRAEVLDCSATGVRLRTLNPLRVGQTYWAKLPGLESREIEVVWVNGFFAGCRFREPLDPRVFKAMLWSTRPGDPPSQVVDRRVIARSV